MEQQTVALAAKGNEAAIASLYEEFSGHVYYICLRYLRNPEDASDATQDTFMTALSRLSQLKEHKRFPQWLSRIAANTCLNKIKRKSPVLFTDFEAKSGVPVEVTIEDNTRENMPEWVCEKQDLRDTLATLVDKLPDAQRIAVMYYYYHQYSVDEISRLTNCSANTIKSRLYMGRARLRTELDKLKIGDERCAFLPISALIAIMGYNSFEFYAPTAVSTALANTIPSISAALKATSLAAAKGTAATVSSKAATATSKGAAMAKGATVAKAATSTAAASASAAATGAATVGGAIATKVIAIGLSATLLLGAGTAAVVAVTKKNAGNGDSFVPENLKQDDGKYEYYFDEPTNIIESNGNYFVQVNFETETAYVQLHPDLHIHDSWYIFHMTFSDKDRERYNINLLNAIFDSDSHVSSIAVCDLQDFIDECRDQDESNYSGFGGTLTIENGLVVDMTNGFLWSNSEDNGGGIFNCSPTF